MAKKIIDSKRPPLLWDTIDDAFSKINDNFTELYLTVGGGGGPVDLTNIGSSINPSDSMIYDLGTPTNRWRRLYVGGGAIYVDNAPITATGTTLELPFGTKVGGVLVKDPAEGSFKNIAVSGQTTVVAEDLKDTLTLVGNGINITTNASTDTVTFNNAGVTSAVAGTGIAVSSATGAVTISNSGVTAVAAGTGIGVSAGTGSVTISNSGVTELIAGSNIILSASTGAITITNGSPNILQNVFRFVAVSGEDTLDPISANSTLNFAAGSNIVLTTNALTNTVTISSPNVQDIVGSIFADDSTLLVDAVDGKIVGPINSFDGANSISMDPTYGVVIGGTGGASVIGAAGASVYIGSGPSGSTTGPIIIGHGSNSVTINGTLTATLSGNSTGYHTGDVKGSVFGQDSTLLVDGTSSRIVGAISTPSLRTSETEIALGNGAGSTSQGVKAIAIGQDSGMNQGDRTIAIGYAAGETNQSYGAISIGENAGLTNQGTRSIAIGSLAGYSNQGQYSIAIGYNAGNGGAVASSIIINASGSAVVGSAAGFYVSPIRSTSSSSAPLMYNSLTKELFYSPTLEFIGSKISTSDSSGIVFDVQTTFQTAVTVDDDLTVNGNIIGYINLATLKSVVAASSSFTDFQTRIAAL